MNKRRVVITGVGAVSPVGNTAPETWAAVLAGRSGIGPITRFDSSAFPTRIAGEVKNFDPSNLLDRKEIRKLDLFSQYALVSTMEAWKGAGLEGHKLDSTRMGCIFGVGIGGLASLEEYHQAYLEGGPRKLSPFLIPKMISNLAPGNVAISLGLRGVNFTVTSACTSSTHAFGEAYRMISTGIQDLVVTGGSEAAVCPIGIGGFCAMRALSTRNEEPTRASRPFDKDRDGFVLSEGGASLILEAYDQAKARGAPMYAEVYGYGFSCDAYHITAPIEGGDGAVRCMTMALQDAGLTAEQVAYINAHGTSTDANDSTESQAIRKVFGEYCSRGLAVSSTKSMTGHLLGAAGAIEALFCVMAVKDGIVPPTINLETPGEGCDLDYVPNTARKMSVPVAMSNSFGFGGTNASIIVGKVR